jgi:outer membrane biosynthesis protein TonB
MHKGYILSILFHITVFLLLALNVNLLKNPKKISYQKFSIHIGPIKKAPPESPQLEKEVTKTTPIAAEIVKKLDKTSATNTKQPENKNKKDTVIEKEIKEKVKEISPKEIKKITKKEVPKDNTQKKPKKISKKSTSNKKKLSPPIKKKKIEKQKPKEDIFSKLVGDGTSSTHLNTTEANLNENDDRKIREQLQKHWNKTPCLSNMLIEVEIMMDSNCNLINRSLKNNYTSSSQLRACAESALKATQKVDKLALELKSCKKHSHQLMNIKFVN